MKPHEQIIHTATSLYAKEAKIKDMLKFITSVSKTAEVLFYQSEYGKIFPSIYLDECIPTIVMISRDRGFHDVSKINTIVKYYKYALEETNIKTCNSLDDHIILYLTPKEILKNLYLTFKEKYDIPVEKKSYMLDNMIRYTLQGIFTTAQYRSLRGMIKHGNFEYATNFIKNYIRKLGNEDKTKEIYHKRGLLINFLNEYLMLNQKKEITTRYNIISHYSGRGEIEPELEDLLKEYNSVKLDVTFLKSEVPHTQVYVEQMGE